MRELFGGYNPGEEMTISKEKNFQMKIIQFLNFRKILFQTWEWWIYKFPKIPYASHGKKNEYKKYEITINFMNIMLCKITNTNYI